MSDLARILQQFEQLQQSVQKKHARKAGRQAMKLVQEQAKWGARRIDDPQTREKIYQNIVIRNGKSRNKNTVVTRVGIQGGAKGLTDGEVQGKGKKNRGGDTFYWRFVEFGTARQRAIPFMRPALATKADAVMNQYADELKQLIEGEIK